MSFVTNANSDQPDGSAEVLPTAGDPRPFPHFPDTNAARDPYLIHSSARAGRYPVTTELVELRPMPILPAEPDMYPGDLWDEVARPVEPGRIWSCLHTKPRQEKATARDLRAAQVPFYLPQVVHEDRTPAGRKTRSTLPLFGGYLFLFGDSTQRLAALRGNRLVNILEVADQSSLVRDLRQIHQMLCSGLAIMPETGAPIGGRIRITNGPLTGLVGTVVRRGKRDHFVAVVKMLGLGATVALEDWQVEVWDE